MQLGGKGAKNKADLLDALGGAPVAEEAAPLMVRYSLQLIHSLPADSVHEFRCNKSLNTLPRQFHIRRLLQLPLLPLSPRIPLVLSTKRSKQIYYTCVTLANANTGRGRVHLAIREKLSLALNRDGGLDSLELKGDLDLRIASPDVAKVVLQLSHSDNFTTNDLQFKTHPRIDKKAWTDSKTIQLRDTKQAFPVRTGLAVLKWRLTSKDESIVPLSSK